MGRQKCSFTKCRCTSQEATDAHPNLVIKCFKRITKEITSVATHLSLQPLQIPKSPKEISQSRLCTKWHDLKSVNRVRATSGLLGWTNTDSQHRSAAHTLCHTFIQYTYNLGCKRLGGGGGGGDNNNAKFIFFHFFIDRCSA